MFNFGILSTHLPYLVLAMTSLLCFVSLGIGQFRSPQQEIPEEKTRYVRYAANRQKQSGVFVYRCISRERKKISLRKTYQPPEKLLLIRAFRPTDSPGFLDTEWMECNLMLAPPVPA